MHSTNPPGSTGESKAEEAGLADVSTPQKAQLPLQFFFPKGLPTAFVNESSHLGLSLNPDTVPQSTAEQIWAGKGPMKREG